MAVWYMGTISDSDRFGVVYFWTGSERCQSESERYPSDSQSSCNRDSCVTVKFVCYSDSKISEIQLYMPKLQWQMLKRQ